MHSTLRFSSLVFVAALSWAAVAGVFALSPAGDTAAHTVAGAFPTAEAGFVSRPTPAAS